MGGWVDTRSEPCVVHLVDGAERRTGCDPVTAWPASCADGHTCCCCCRTTRIRPRPHNAGYNGSRARWSRMYPTLLQIIEAHTSCPLAATSLTPGAHPTTTQVYDGSRARWTEDDECKPVNVYGR